MKGYLYEHMVKARGYVEVSSDHCTENEKSKEFFVRGYLAPTLRASNCGWDWAEYKVMQTPSGIRTEFLVLWAEEIGNSGSRWINVTGNSLGAIMCAMCENLW